MSYDRSAGKTPGMIYARHDPDARRRVDLLELERCLPYVLKDPLRCRLIVAACYSLHPLAFPRFKDLTQEELWHAYAIASHSGESPFTHAITLHSRPGQIMGEILNGKGPASVFGDFINDKIEPIYRRAGVPLRFGYKIEVHRPQRDDGTGKLHVVGAEDWHATIMIRIPDELVPRLRKMLAREGNLDKSLVTRHHNGTRVHLSDLRKEKRWTSGADASGRGGLIGKADYAAKDGTRLRHVHESYIALNPNLFKKLCHASRDVLEAARIYYEASVESIAAAVPQDLLAGLTPMSAPDPFLEAWASPATDEQTTIRRLLAADHLLAAIAGLAVSPKVDSLRSVDWPHFVRSLHEVLTEVRRSSTSICKHPFPFRYGVLTGEAERVASGPS
jgi:hypothetical protein